MWRDTFADANEEPEAATGCYPPDDPQHMLISAYTRLFLLPVRLDGLRHTTVASFGAYEVRLADVPTPKATPKVPPIWLELYDRSADRSVDSAGCWDLDEAEKALKALNTEALCRNGIAPSDSAWR
jgi:hypothetical protein